MALKLICNQDPQALGIANEAGDWNLAKFEEHLKTCQVCQRFAGALIKEMSDVFGDLVDTCNGFLKKKKTIGELRQAVKKAKKQKGE